MFKDSPVNYYQNNKEDHKKSLMKNIEFFLKKKVSLNMENKDYLSIQKDTMKCRESTTD